MFVHHIAYRYANGDLATFSGAGLTPATAAQNSVYRAKHAVATERREAFDMAHVIADFATLTAAERSRIDATRTGHSYLMGLA